MDGFWEGGFCRWDGFGGCDEEETTAATYEDRKRAVRSRSHLVIVVIIIIKARASSFPTPAYHQLPISSSPFLRLLLRLGLRL
jgi:hypothetical protein